MNHHQLTIGPQALLAAAQDFTGSWVDLGSELDTRGMRTIGLWLELDVNSGVNMRVRALAKLAKAATNEYCLSIRTASASDIKVEPEYIEFNTDADQLAVLSWDLDHVVPIVQFQISAGTAGTPAAQVDSAYVTMGY